MLRSVLILAMSLHEDPTALYFVQELDIATPGKEVAEQIDQLKRERDQLELLQIQQNDADLLALHHLHTKNVVEEAAKVGECS